MPAGVNAPKMSRKVEGAIRWPERGYFEMPMLAPVAAVIVRKD